jgi:large subunit ribosomal protein L9
VKQQLLLLQDVDALGQKGEIVTARPGYVRNFLIPQGFAVVATPNMLRKQERLKAEREKQAVIDRAESEELLRQIEAIGAVETRVKVDPEGHMYGSVNAADIAQLFQEKGLPIERKNVLVTRPIKETGTHKITVKLKEGITAVCQLNIIPEGMVQTGAESVVAPIPGTEETETSAE